MQELVDLIQLVSDTDATKQSSWLEVIMTLNFVVLPILLIIAVIAIIVLLADISNRLSRIEKRSKLDKKPADNSNGRP